MPLLRRMVCAPSLAAIPGAAFAQLPQGEPIRMVIGFPASGPIDTVARLLAPHFVDGIGQPVIVDNRAGANGIIATEIVGQFFMKAEIVKWTRAVKSAHIRPEQAREKVAPD